MLTPYSGLSLINSPSAADSLIYTFLCEYSSCIQLLMRVVRGNLIDELAFDLCVPPREEMLKHRCDLLCSELDVRGVTFDKLTRTVLG